MKLRWKCVPSIQWTFVFVASVVLNKSLLVRATATNCWTGHDIVEYKLCHQVEQVLPCKADRLTIVTRQNVALTCGENIDPQLFATMPMVRVTPGIRLTQGGFYVLVIVGPDAPSRAGPTDRYWNHGIFADIPVQDLISGNIESGSGITLTTYSPPAPGPGTMRHRYQLFLFQQSSSTTGTQMTGYPTLPTRAQFDLQTFVNANNLCTAGSLKAAFQFTCTG